MGLEWDQNGLEWDYSGIYRMIDVTNTDQNLYLPVNPVIGNWQEILPCDFVCWCQLMLVTYLTSNWKVRDGD